MRRRVDALLRRVPRPARWSSSCSRPSRSPCCRPAPPCRRRPSGSPDWPVAKGAYHIHSARSDGTGTIDEIAAAAARAGLQFVILTDHGDGTRAPEPPSYRSGVLCHRRRGDQHRATATTWRSALPQTPYRLGGHPRDVIEDVDALGGFGIAAHPGSPKPDLRWDDWDAPFDGLEWLNADSEWRDELWGSLGRVLLTYAFRPTETLTSLLDRPGARDRAVGPARARAPRDWPGRRRRARTPRVPAGERAVSGSRARARAVVRRVVPRVLESCRARRTADRRGGLRRRARARCDPQRARVHLDRRPGDPWPLRSEGAERDRVRAGGGVSRPARPGRDRCADYGARRHDAGRRPRWAGDLRRTVAQASASRSARNRRSTGSRRTCRREGRRGRSRGSSPIRSTSACGPRMRAPAVATPAAVERTPISTA